MTAHVQIQFCIFNYRKELETEDSPKHWFLYVVKRHFKKRAYIQTSGTPLPKKDRPGETQTATESEREIEEEENSQSEALKHNICVNLSSDHIKSYCVV